MARIVEERELPYSADVVNRALRWAARADPKFGYVTRDEPDRLQIVTERPNVTNDVRVVPLTPDRSLLQWETRSVFSVNRGMLRDAIDRLVAMTMHRIQRVGPGMHLFAGTLLGGYQTAIPLRSTLHFGLSEAGLHLVAGQANFTVPAEDLVDLAFSGPGRTTTGGGFVGGGFGPLGFAEGAIVASLLNTLTTRTEVNALVHAVATDAEYMIHTSAATPEELVLLGSGLTGSIAAHRRSAQAHSHPAGIADQIAKLASLRDSGALTDEEFALAKSRVLGTQ